MEKMKESKVRDRLWIGSWQDAERLLNDDRFVIVTVAEDAPVKGHHYFPLSDPGKGPTEAADLARAADTVIAVLNDTDKEVLVHCFSGINRSTSVVIAVLMKLEGLSLLDAYNKIMDVRPFIWPWVKHLQAALDYNNSTEVLNTSKLPHYGGKDMYE